jgi:hypothetical protein
MKIIAVEVFRHFYGVCGLAIEFPCLSASQTLPMEETFTRILFSLSLSFL